MRIKLVFLIVLLYRQAEGQTCTSGSNGCVTCSSPTTCSVCESDLWLDSTGAGCQACSTVIPNCHTCIVGATQTQCSFCDPLNKYYLQNPTTCTQCPGSDEFVTFAGDGCNFCGVIIYDCVSCDVRIDGTICTQCQSNFLTDSKKQCNLCFDVITGCIYCVTVADFSTQCTTCQASSQYALVSSTRCEQCSPPEYLNLDHDACLPCIQAIPGCYRCNSDSSGTICQGCSVFPQQHYMVSTTECRACDHTAGQFLTTAFDGCVNCESLIANCEQCNPFPTGGTYCQRCTVSQQFYTQITSCAQCRYQTMDEWLRTDLRGCDLCANVINGCQVCAAGSTGTICTLCIRSQFVTPTQDACARCDIAIEGCLQCQVGATDTQCVSCDVGNQYARISSTFCQQCVNEDDQWVDRSNSTCDTCEAILPGCKKCGAVATGTICVDSCSPGLQQFSTASGCSTCSNAAGLFLNQAGNACARCEEALLNCAECESGPDGTVCVGCSIGEQEFMFPGNNFCTRCFNEENFYVDADGVGCSFCEEAIPGCESCYAGPAGTLCSRCEVGHPSCILDTCGDVLEGQEGCDDGNVKSGDGCSSACAVQPGWKCVGVLGQPSVCSNVCGDGRVDEGETCDDGNQQPSDGCSEYCIVESGWKCSYLGKSYCDLEPLCGNGLLQLGSNEGCDDGNSLDGDGCSGICTVEAEWLCSSEWRLLSVCVRMTLCGNSFLDTGEGCDNGNLANSDGCSSGCEVEPGWKCILTNAGSSACFPVPPEAEEPEELPPPNLRAFTRCGNAQLNPPEQCDDGNSDNGDGCGDNCVIELGYFCELVGSLSDCRRIGVCGNKYRDHPDEECDDGNLMDGDGCDQRCKVEGESGFCGNGLFQPESGEACDDGDLVDSNGCNTLCQLNPAFDCQNEPLQKTVCSVGVDNAATNLPVSPCMNDYRPPSRDLIPEEIEIYQAVLGQAGVNTIGQAAILLYSNPQFQIPVYEMYVQKRIENLWFRIQSNIFICQGLISI